MSDNESWVGVQKKFAKITIKAKIDDQDKVIDCLDRIGALNFNEVTLNFVNWKFISLLIKKLQNLKIKFGKFS